MKKMYIKEVDGKIAYHSWINFTGTTGEVNLTDVQRTRLGANISNWKFNDTDWVVMSALEITARVDAKNLPGALEQLYRGCMGFQISELDINAQAELSKSESLVEGGKAVEADLPMAKAVGAWMETLWADYYIRKVDVLNASNDFSATVPCPHAFAELRAERKTFLASL